MSERVQLAIDHHVATVRMSRPEKRNALDPGMFEGLITTGAVSYTHLTLPTICSV